MLKPENVARIHYGICARENCAHISTLNYLDPCDSCPSGHFGPYIMCQSDHPRLPVEPIAHIPFGMPRPSVQGPGTVLTVMLATLGIHPAVGCQCKARASTMDTNGCTWCLEHIDQIVGWIKEEANRAHFNYFPKAFRLLIRLPIFPVVAQLLIRFAILKSRFSTKCIN